MVVNTPSYPNHAGKHDGGRDKHRYRWQAQQGANTWQLLSFLLHPGLSGVQSMGSSLCNKLTETPFADLTDVTLADEDTNPILTDNANRAIQGNVAMQVTQPGRKICK